MDESRQQQRLKARQTHGMADSVHCRQIMAELIHGNAQIIQAMCNECTDKMLNDNPKDPRAACIQTFFEAVAFGGGTVMAMFVDGSLSVPKIKAEIEQRRRT